MKEIYSRFAFMKIDPGLEIKQCKIKFPKYLQGYSVS